MAHLKLNVMLISLTLLLLSLLFYLFFHVMDTEFSFIFDRAWKKKTLTLDSRVKMKIGIKYLNQVFVFLFWLEYYNKIVIIFILTAWKKFWRKLETRTKPALTFVWILKQNQSFPQLSFHVENENKFSINFCFKFWKESNS